MSFAGPRVVQQTTREKLPDDFGRAESNFRFGNIDMIVPRHELRGMLARLLRLFAGGEFVYAVADETEEAPSGVLGRVLHRVRRRPHGAAATRTGARHRKRGAIRAPRPATAHRRAARPSRDIWDAVELARHDERPYTLDYAERLLDDFTELPRRSRRRRGSGDRRRPRPLPRPHDRARRAPEGPRSQAARLPQLRPALGPRGTPRRVRVFELASRLGFPVLTFVDTQGAHPGSPPRSAARPARSRARCLAMGRLSVPRPSPS